LTEALHAGRSLAKARHAFAGARHALHRAAGGLAGEHAAGHAAGAAGAERPEHGSPPPALIDRDLLATEFANGGVGGVCRAAGRTERRQEDGFLAGSAADTGRGGRRLRLPDAVQHGRRLATGLRKAAATIATEPRGLVARGGAAGGTGPVHSRSIPLPPAGHYPPSRSAMISRLSTLLTAWP
jgi:hypothetical protein